MAPKIEPQPSSMRWTPKKVKFRFATLATVFVSLMNNLIQESKEILNKQSLPSSEPSVSFIIPSSLERYSLHVTIASLRNQTETNWEAIVGVDIRKSIYKSVAEIAEQSEHFIYNLYDRRVRYVPIYSNSFNRGEIGNGSGDIRNKIIKHHARADWVAFVDDDDTLSPYYIELLQEGIRQDKSADIFIFHMEVKDGWIVPPRSHGVVAFQNYVGISFAARRKLFVSNADSLAFSPHRTEDFNFLFSAQTKNAVIKISPEVTYFIRRPPSMAKPLSSCFERAILRVNLTPPVESNCHSAQRKD